MSMKLCRRNLRTLALLVLAVPLLVYAYSTGPIPGVTGGFGEPSCTECHTGMALNSGPGGVAISAPQSYASGGAYPITVTVSDPNQRRWGFELSARTQNGQQAGTLIPGADGFTQLIAQGGIQYIEHTLAGTRNGTRGGADFTFSWQAPDSSAGPVIFNVAANAANGDFSNTGDRIYASSETAPPASEPVLSNFYYFPHFALGGGWQTTITHINYSPDQVTCVTTFFSDSGDPLSVPFGESEVSSRMDMLAPGGVIHQETTAALGDPEVGGWAQARCSGPIKTSLLFRFYQQGVPVGEAGVNAMATPATKFVTFADQTTGVAYANPSADSAQITLSALDSSGVKLADKILTLLPGQHGAQNIGPLLGLENFRGSIRIVSTVPIVSLSLNFEASPAFSSLPPGELDDSTPLATGTGQ
jgi:hypothetical protein